MKRILFVSALVLIASSFAFGQAKNAKETEVKLIQMDRGWTAAEMKGDAKTAGMYVADDFWGTTPEGKVENKTQYLAGIKADPDNNDVADDY